MSLFLKLYLGHLLGDFLLQPGELLRAVEGLRIVAFEDGFVEAPERFVQRIAAVREPATGDARRYLL